MVLNTKQGMPTVTIGTAPTAHRVEVALSTIAAHENGDQLEVTILAYSQRVYAEQALRTGKQATQCMKRIFRVGHGSSSGVTLRAPF